MTAPPSNQHLAFDAQAGAALRARAARDPQGAVKASAKQFEALFMEEVMKRMRASTLSSGLMDNEASKLGTETFMLIMAPKAALMNTAAIADCTPLWSTASSAMCCHTIPKMMPRTVRAMKRP